ncbi:DUF1894 domain-containing protein [Methanothermobacter marburgensis]|uniref:DUF1894 domain-containing protein n=1 Tax=Methanothermobacter marburgensis (strain ATCC BAA-927 / DSM 2133 / JCM 14651 / NBRC 100331 / OCM 82 / Marburg) TaxID=79929 RepID=D9PX17_METTM|nr:DUF1894 domain-containing protein [Methanothermobacter marburgensis]ADL58765.1 conserved hypothetical protein [Methanothermobacter marburgensis str. Marburg]WBF09327.1 DUF1894 domain-containing protein [Methanothermobacter marburgensis]
MSFCIETYLQQSDDYEIHMTRSGFRECAAFIEKKAKRVVHIRPGEKILGARIIGIPPVPVGIDKERSTVMIPYTKPCYGTAVIEIPVDEDEIERIIEVAEH